MSKNQLSDLVNPLSCATFLPDTLLKSQIISIVQFENQIVFPDSNALNIRGARIIYRV